MHLILSLRIEVRTVTLVGGQELCLGSCGLAPIVSHDPETEEMVTSSDLFLSILPGLVSLDHETIP